MSLTLLALKSIQTVVAHDKCPDGIAAALIVRNALPDAKVIFCQYNTPAHLELAPEPGMVFVDFSPHRSRVQEFVDAEAIVLDHHKTAKEVVEMFGTNGVFGDEVADPGISGPMLAYREIWKPLAYDRGPDYVAAHDFARWVEQFARIAGIRDTWQKQSPEWTAACIQSSALFFVPQAELMRTGLYDLWRDWEDKYEWAGSLSYYKHQKTVARAASEGFRYVTPQGTKLLVFQGTKLSSDAAEAAGAADADVICGFDVIFEGGVIKYLYSCRSRNGYDVSALAKRYGGGGHRAAAGFNVESPGSDPYTLFLLIVQDFEAEKASEAFDRR